MSASFRLDTRGIHRIANSFSNEAVKNAISQIPNRLAVAALVGQAIADNFDQEGPGWAPLKASTIRGSVNKSMRKSLANMTDEEILAHEGKARKKGSETEPFRKILQKSRLLYRTVTTPGYRGSNPNGVNGGNIWKVEGNNLIWGTDLPYAEKMNNGDPKSHVPARPFLTIRKEWVKRMQDYVAESITEIIQNSLRQGGSL